MRTTLTLDADVEALLKKRMEERGVSFKEAVNESLREGLGGKPPREPFRTPTFNLGLKPGIDLTKANQLAAQLEDEEIIRKLRAGK